MSDIKNSGQVNLRRTSVVSTCSKCSRPNCAKWNCVKCKKILCDGCKKVHGRKSFFKSHSFTSIETLETSHKEEAINSNLMCSCEGKGTISLFCAQCSELVCVACIASKHNGHSFEKLENVNQQKKNQIQSKISEIDNIHMPHMNDLQAKVGILQARHTTKSKKTKEEILSRQAYLKNQIDGWTNALLHELDDFSITEQTKLSKFQPILQSQLKRLQQEKQRLVCLASSDNTQLLVLGVDKSVKEWESLTLPSVNDIQYAPGPDILSNFPSPLGSFSIGNRKATSVQSSDEQSPTTDYDHADTVSIDDTVDGAFDFLTHEEDEIESASKLSLYPTELVKITSISAISPELFWIGDIRTQCIHLVRKTNDGSLQTIAQINTKFIDFSVFKGEDSLWISCLEDNSLSVITPQGKKLSSKGFQSLLPTCVYVTPKETVLLGLSEKRSLWVDKNSVRKLVEIRPPGTILFEIERDKNDMAIFTFPLRCSVNKKTGDILAIDSTGQTDGRIIMCSTDGALNHIYTGDISLTLEKPFDPTGVTSVATGNVVVCDYSNSLLHILDRNGMLLKAVSANELAIEMPYSITTDWNGNILIGNWPINGEKSKLYLIDDRIFSSSAVCV